MQKTRAGNQTIKKINYEIDKTKPKIKINSPEQGLTYEENNVKLDYEFSDRNLSSENSYEFNEDGIQNYFSSPSGTIPLNSKEGENKLEILVKDLAGNESDTTVTYKYDPKTGIDDNVNYSKKKPYPNPAKEIVRFEFVNTFGEDMEIEMYNSAGQLIGGKKTYKESFDYDISDYSRGLIIYRIKDSSGKTIDSGKTIKE